MDEGKFPINLNSPVQGLVIGDSSVTNNFYVRTGQFDWGTTLPRACDLRSESFKLGDAAAARFPYVIAPIQHIYDQATQALYDASNEVGRAKHGILILGESNAGKTRLALEALKKVLPDWPVLRWRPDYPMHFAPPVEILQKKHLILFVDDLQDYAFAGLRDSNSQFSVVNPRATTLRSLIEILIQATQHTIVVVTCRAEDQEQTQTAFNWLFVQLAPIFLPSFNTNPQDTKAAQIITEFQKQGTIQVEDWDGTLGSLVLGLSTKNSQYLALPASSRTVLQAMKLLQRTNTRKHTERRIRTLCKGVFRNKELLEDEEIWQETINRLTQMQFVKEEIDEDNQEVTLIIRKDSYFERIVTDYPAHYRHQKIEQDFARLQRLFVELEDAHALYNLGRTYIDLKRYREALVALDHALALNPNDSVTWVLKGLIYGVSGGLNQPEEALIALDQALALNPNDSHAWLFKGKMLGALNRYEEAFAAAHQAILYDPNNADAWIVKGHALKALNQLKEALSAFDHAILLNPNNFDTWYDKGYVLAELGLFAQALSAFEQVVSLDPNNADVWYYVGLMRGVLKQHADALAAFDRATLLDPNNADAWKEKARMLIMLMHPEEGLTALDRSLSLEPNDAEAWSWKGIVLGTQEYHKYKEGLTALDRSLSLDPNNVEVWEYKGRILLTLKRFAEALDVFDHILTLDPSITTRLFGRLKGNMHLEVEPNVCYT